MAALVVVDAQSYCRVKDISGSVLLAVLLTSIQTSVAGTSLSFVGWLLAQLRMSDDVMIGKSMMVQAGRGNN